MRHLLLVFFLLACSNALSAQVSVSTDTSNANVRSAVNFLINYLTEFSREKKAEYNKYWRIDQTRKRWPPDDMVYAITTDHPTYNFSKTPLIYYAERTNDFIHIKTIFPHVSFDQVKEIWAITNHYVFADNDGKHYFKSEMDVHHEYYATTEFGNINYHYPKTHSFNPKKAEELVDRLAIIENEWGLLPIPVAYYFADSRPELDRMRGFDYCWGMDETEPNGISFQESGTVFCQGLGEDYLHEVLHLYFNPRYAERSPLCHGLVYYLGGSLGRDFSWFVSRMNDYLEKYPETDLSNFETIETKDKLLHIDNIVKGFICKLIYEKDGVKGLKRIMEYKVMDEVFLKEFSVKRSGVDKLLKTLIAKAATDPVLKTK
jgi:hypothetical protein